MITPCNLVPTLITLLKLLSNVTSGFLIAKYFHLPTLLQPPPEQSLLLWLLWPTLWLLSACPVDSLVLFGDPSQLPSVRIPHSLCQVVFQGFSLCCKLLAVMASAHPALAATFSVSLWLQPFSTIPSSDLIVSSSPSQSFHQVGSSPELLYVHQGSHNFPDCSSSDFRMIPEASPFACQVDP